MRKFVVYVLLGWSQLLLCVDGTRKEQTAAPKEINTALRRKGKVALAQVHVSAKNVDHADTGPPAKVMPMHSVNAMTTSVPGHRPRAFVVAGILVAITALMLAIFASIHRKVSEDVANPGNPQGFRGLLGHALSPVPIAHHGLHHTSAHYKRNTKTLRSEAPGDLRRVEDEIAELTKDLTPPASPESHQPEPAVEHESKVETEVLPETCMETAPAPLPDSLLENFSITTPTKAKSSERLHPALGEAPLPTPPPRSPPKRRKRGKSDDVADQAMPEKMAAAVVPPSDLRNLDDEFAELTRDLCLGTSAVLAPSHVDDVHTQVYYEGDTAQSPSAVLGLAPHASQAFSAKDFAEVKTLRAVWTSELRSHDHEFSELIQDLQPSSNRSSPLGELRSFQDEISQLAEDLHSDTQEHSLEPENEV